MAIQDGMYVPIEEVCARALSIVCVEVGIESGCGSKSRSKVGKKETSPIASVVHDAHHPPSSCRSCYPTRTFRRLSRPSVLSSSSSSESPLEGEGRAGGGDGPRTCFCLANRSRFICARSPRKDSGPAPAATVAGAGGGVGSRTDRIAIEGVGG
jgi:hypothetical protein